MRVYERKFTVSSCQEQSPGREPLVKIQERYEAYAAAFEETFADGDWTRLESYFTKDAKYRVIGAGPDVIGRDAVLASLKESVDHIDRRMDAREVTVRETRVEDAQLVARAYVALKKAGAPDLTFFVNETATFRGDRIELLVDEIDPSDALETWMAQHAALLEDVGA